MKNCWNNFGNFVRKYCYSGRAQDFDLISYIVNYDPFNSSIACTFLFDGIFDLLIVRFIAQILENDSIFPFSAFKSRLVRLPCKKPKIQCENKSVKLKCTQASDMWWKLLTFLALVSAFSFRFLIFSVSVWDCIRLSFEIVHVQPLFYCLWHHIHPKRSMPNPLIPPITY